MSKMEPKIAAHNLSNGSKEPRGVNDRKEGGFRGLVRLATPSDFEAIMAINDNVYDGLDYMPVMFHPFMHSKLHKIYLYEEDGKVVALVNLQFHPDRDDLVTCASMRVHPSYEGRGIPSATGPIFTQVLKEHPKMKQYIAYAKLTEGLRGKIPESSITEKTNFLKFQVIDRSNLERFGRSGSISEGPSAPINVSYSTGLKWITSSDQLARFLARYSEYLPITTCWFPVLVNHSGLRQLFSVSNACVTFDQPAMLLEQARDLNIDTNSNKLVLSEGREIRGFSYSFTLLCAAGIYFDVQFFGDCVDVLMDHVRKYVRHLLETTFNDTPISFGVHFPPGVNAAEVEKRLEDELGKRLPTEYREVIQYFVVLRKWQ